MQQQMQQIPVSQQIAQMTQKLSQLFAQKADAEAAIKQFDIEITALRNVLAGVGLGQKLASEAAEQAKPAAEPSVP